MEKSTTSLLLLIFFQQKLYNNIQRLVHINFRDMANKDDEIIRTRLLLDGEGAGDDRKLTLILKSFLKVNMCSKFTL